jgi:hypothetical protein
MKPKAPGTYYMIGNKPIAFAGVDAETGEIVSREIFSISNEDQRKRILEFIKNRVSEANFIELDSGVAEAGTKDAPVDESKQNTGE